jgi:hypothetical protein
MILSDLINYRNRLEELSAGYIFEKSNLEFLKVFDIVKQSTIPVGSIVDELDAVHKTIFKEYENFEVILTQFKDKIRTILDEQGQPWFMESTKRYLFDSEHQSEDWYLQRQSSIPVEDKDFYISRLQTYSSWKYPGLMFRPGLHNLVQHMVCYDPLYLVDKTDNLLFPCQLEFPEQYRRRLRPVVIDEQSESSLDQLPDNQFGLALAYDYFNFMPLYIVERILQQVFVKLRPGGTVCFTFNDCDTSKGMQLVENYRASYIPGRAIKHQIKSMGYELVFEYNNHGPTTWIELRKPGKLESIRGGQVMTQVKPNHSAPTNILPK